MGNVTEFIEWALKRAKRRTVPKGAVLLISNDLVGSVTEAEYLWGTSGRKVTQSLLDARYSSYYKKNGWTKAEYEAATKGWVAAGKHVTDCQGLLDWYLGNDTNANGNYVNYCTDKGLCSAINRKYVIGEAVFNGSSTKKTHVGWVCGFMPDGDPLVVEARGLSYGVVITRMSKRSWKYRGLMTKKFSYTANIVQPSPSLVPSNGYKFTRVLKYGMRGDDVIELKKLLIKEGYSKGITTNTSSSKNFYGSTRTQVRAFQKDAGLTVDGKAGKQTITALGGIWKG